MISPFLWMVFFFVCVESHFISPCPSLCVVFCFYFFLPPSLSLFVLPLSILFFMVHILIFPILTLIILFLQASLNGTTYPWCIFLGVEKIIGFVSFYCAELVSIMLEVCQLVSITICLLIFGQNVYLLYANVLVMANYGWA